MARIVGWTDNLREWWDGFSAGLRDSVPSLVDFSVIVAKILVLLVLGWLLSRIIRRIHVPLNRWLRKRFEVVVEARVIRSVLSLFVWFIIIYTMFTVIPGVGQQTASFLSAGLAIIIALSSQSIIANAMNGVMIRMVKPYKVGDVVEIAQHGVGVVTQVGLLYTRVQDAKHRIITIPNQHVLSEGVINYTNEHYIAHCVVGLGYDVDRWEIEKALKRAAVKCELEKPNVMVTFLGDFAINYEINGITRDVTNFVSIESNLKIAVIDELHNAGIEITSPAYEVSRQVAKGSDNTVPVMTLQPRIKVQEGVTAQVSKMAIEEVEKKVEEVEKEEVEAATKKKVLEKQKADQEEKDAEISRIRDDMASALEGMREVIDAESE